MSVTAISISLYLLFAGAVIYSIIKIDDGELN